MHAYAHKECPPRPAQEPTIPGPVLAALAVVLGLLFFSLSAEAQSGGPFTIVSSTIDGGGATSSTGGAFSLGGTIGQPDASGALTGGAFSVTGGFWPGVLPGGLRGDANADGSRSILDVFYAINALFANGPQPSSACLADANNDGAFSVLDVFFLINHLFANGPAPASC
jgi:hypothetical protein